MSTWTGQQFSNGHWFGAFGDTGNKGRREIVGAVNTAEVEVPDKQGNRVFEVGELL